MKAIAVTSCVIEAFCWAIYCGYLMGATIKSTDGEVSDKIAGAGVIAILASIANIICIWVITS